MKSGVILFAGAVAGATLMGFWFVQLRDIDRRLALGRDQLQRSAAELARRRQTLAGLEKTAGAENEAARRPDVSSPHNAEIAARVAQVHALQLLFANRPEHVIPEMQLLTAADWLQLAQSADGSTDVTLRESLANVRARAKAIFCTALGQAVRKYTESNNGSLPSDLSQLAPLFDGNLPLGALERYEIRPVSTGTNAIFGGDPIRERSAVDADYDTRMYLGPKGSRGWYSPWIMTDLNEDITQARQQLGQPAAAEGADLEKLLPLVHTPMARGWLEARMAYQQAGGRGYPLPEKLLPYAQEPATRHLLEVLVAAKQRAVK
jgi:hypothetical protein